jgi:uncharacterized membrane protein
MTGVIQQALDLEVPARTAYDQFTQFLDFPRFVPVLREAEQIDDTHVRWRAELGDEVVASEWEICEQIPDKRIAWKSVGGRATAASSPSTASGTASRGSCSRSTSTRPRRARAWRRRSTSSS